MVFLEFEKPLENLYEQLEKIQQVAEEGDLDMSDSIKELENKLAFDGKMPQSRWITVNDASCGQSYTEF